MTLSERDDNTGETPERTTRREVVRAYPTEVPEYPSLAPHVELLGEMEDTGFRERQWLIRRGDQFIQLTELLYRIAEQADGESTHEEMAEALTRSTDWLVSAENVRQLLLTKLLPLGIVLPARGDALAAASEGHSSPLRINARTRLLGPEVIDPIAKVLQVLFAPVLLVPILLTVAFAHGWMYLEHGLGGAIRDVFYTPGLIFAVLGVLFVSGVFHELGHAAALRYGGGRTRGMGFGLYLVYPALYTDTTDSYRLGRWARVRTDLGGFYFHLIFAFGLIALSLLTGWEFLLMAVLLINAGIIYQCMPFVRFDGYWALADLTGIPDFFSQMGAFLRSVLPLPGWKGARLPDLKPWVKLVFAAYVIVTVPVLSLLMFNLIVHLPGTATIFWRSLVYQAAEFSGALDEGSPVGMAISVAQMLVLCLQTLGIAYLMYSLAQMLVRMIHKRSVLRDIEQKGRSCNRRDGRGVLQSGGSACFCDVKAAEEL